MGGQGREKGSVNKIPRKPSLSVGEIHGRLVILAYEGSRRLRPGDARADQYWTCRCLLCGSIASKTTAALRSRWQGCRCVQVVPDACFHRAFRTYKRQARLRGLSFDLSLEELKSIMTKPCYYCGQEPRLNSYSEDSKIRVPMNGIDRRDSKLSYTLENCLPACGPCNLAKLDTPEKDFTAWAVRLSWHQDKVREVSSSPALCMVGVPKPDEEWELEGEAE